ncbi:heterokaryon incompatibility protein-domain-containing protein [Pyrenochaeta sp. MPI-SDFR-AT-0127]|nr:heterokaryon incompatibility protein-domain-containing protein [Pyrenochaeta sp. MPI-SDFR-AT-0127]
MSTPLSVIKRYWQQYFHKPLKGPRATRVLELQPAGDISAPIHCSLEAISLNDYPEWGAHYTALSYTWDGQTPNCEVNCDGKSLLITPNCDAAIRQLRSTTETKILWIDSICIDQQKIDASLAERNTHVALMGEIYKSAAKVVVWLGGENKPVEAAMSKLVEIAKLCVEKIESGADRRVVQQLMRDHTKSISDSVTNQADDPFGPLFECSWFYRMWTIQEVTLAFVDRIVFRCGSLEVKWTTLLMAMDTLKTSQYQWGRWKEATALQRQLFTYLVVRRIPGAREMLDDDKGTYHNDPVPCDIMANTRQKLSGDPKDKVFALYGLFKELDVPFPKPNYSMPVEDVYREATAAVIEYDKNLYVLYHVPSDRRLGELASWVPDWSEAGFEPHDSRYGVLRDRFAASGPAAHTWRFSEDQKALIVRGKIVDTIILKGQPMPSSERFTSLTIGDEVDTPQDEFMQFQHDVSAIFRSWIDISKWADYPTGEPSKEVLQRTLTQDFPRSNAAAAKDNSFSDWYDNMGLDELDLLASGLRRMNFGDKIPHEPSRRYDYLRKFKDQVSEQTISFLAFARNDFHNLAMVSVAMKCFFYTEHEYFGTAPDPLPVSIEAGDKIVIISGLEMPLVIRPVEGGYRLITHVFVHGMMYGEMWPESESELQDIVLL